MPTPTRPRDDARCAAHASTHGAAESTTSIARPLTTRAPVASVVDAEGGKPVETAVGRGADCARPGAGTSGAAKFDADATASRRASWRPARAAAVAAALARRCSSSARAMRSLSAAVSVARAASASLWEERRRDSAWGGQWVATIFGRARRQTSRGRSTHFRFRSASARIARSRSRRARFSESDAASTSTAAALAAAFE